MVYVFFMLKLFNKVDTFDLREPTIYEVIFNVISKIGSLLVAGILLINPVFYISILITFDTKKYQINIDWNKNRRENFKKPELKDFNIESMDNVIKYLYDFNGFDFETVEEQKNIKNYLEAIVNAVDLMNDIQASEDIYNEEEKENCKAVKELLFTINPIKIFKTMKKLSKGEHIIPY